MAVPLPPGFEGEASAAGASGQATSAALPGGLGPVPANAELSGVPGIQGFPAFQPFTPLQPFAGDAMNPFASEPSAGLKAGKARAPSAASRPPELTGQSVEQNEKDMYEGPLLRELGVDPAMIAWKLVAALPFAPVDREVAQSGEMVIGFATLMLFTLVACFSPSQSHVSAFFSLFAYGVLMMRLLLNFLLQGNLELDVYTIASAQSYGLVAVLFSAVACSIVRKVMPAEGLARRALVLALSCLGGAGFGCTTTKLLNEATGLHGVKLLVAFPAFLLACCYVMLLSL